MTMQEHRKDDPDGSDYRWYRAVPPAWRPALKMAATIATFVAVLLSFLLGPALHWVRSRTNETAERAAHAERTALATGAESDKRMASLEERVQTQITDLRDALRIEQTRAQMRDIERKVDGVVKAMDSYDEIASGRHGELIKRLDEMQKKKR